MKRFYQVILKALVQIAPLVLFVMLMAPACKKNKDEPTLPEPIVQHDVVVDWNWDDGIGYAPPMDTIKKYAQDKYVNNIFINLTDPNSTGMGVKHFRRAHDSLQTRIDVAPTRVRGMGTIYPTRADIPDFDPFVIGMCIEDSLWFTNHGWAVQRYQHIK